MVEGVLRKTFSQNSNAMELITYLKNNYPNGNYHSAYEAGFFGFGPHRDLVNYDIHNIVVNPADILTTNKEKDKKDDTLDSKKIVRSLHNKELDAIYVASTKAEPL